MNARLLDRIANTILLGSWSHLCFTIGRKYQVEKDVEYFNKILDKSYDDKGNLPACRF